MIFSAIVITIPTAKAEVPPLPFIITPNEDLWTEPSSIAPGSSPGWWSYNPTYSVQLAYNHTDYPVFYEWTGVDLWAEIRLGFSDIPESVSESWDAFEMTFFIRKGINTFTYWGGYVDTVNYGGDLVQAVNSDCGKHYSVNPSTGIPFTRADINGLNGRIVTYSETGAQRSWTYFQIMVYPVEYNYTTPTQYILRPSGDYSDGLEISNMTWEPTVPTACWDEINETNVGGNGLTTYLHARDTAFDYDFHYTGGVFDMTNMPGTASRNTLYSITIWAICWSSVEDIPVQLYDRIVLGPYQRSMNFSMEDAGPTSDDDDFVSTRLYGGGITAKQNVTAHFDINPRTLRPFTLDELNSLKVWTLAWNHGGQSSNMTQMAVLVTTSTAGDYVIVSPIEVSFDLNMNAIIWLLIIFIPGIAIGRIISIGFYLGIILILIVTSLTEPGFTSVLIIGFMSIGAMLFRSD